MQDIMSLIAAGCSDPRHLFPIIQCTVAVMRRTVRGRRRWRRVSQLVRITHWCSGWNGHTDALLWTVSTGDRVWHTAAVSWSAVCMWQHRNRLFSPP